MALDLPSSLSRKLAYVPGPTFGFMKLLVSSGSHCTKRADQQHKPAGFESRLVPDLSLHFIPTLIGLRAFHLVSSCVWWEAATNKWHVLCGAHTRKKSYVIRCCIRLTATSNDRFNTLSFFFTNRLATGLSPTSCGRFTLLFLQRYALKAPLVRSVAQR